jgi:excisionase family DNA binding protein
VTRPASTPSPGRPARPGQDDARELSGLLRPDGSVLVPVSIAAEVLRRLVRDMVTEARTSAGQPSPAARALLYALHEAAQRHEQDVAICDTLGVEQVSQGLTVREVAQRMGCSTSWVRQLLATGRLVGRRAGGVWIVETSAYAPRPCSGSTTSPT